LLKEKSGAFPFTKNSLCSSRCGRSFPSNPDQVETPQWHKDILDSREEAVKRGESKLLEWDEAKEQISRMIR
jgi:hypothetical protein